MKRYNLSRIMKSAHRIRKYMKLYSVTHGVKNWGDCVRLAWANEKDRMYDEKLRRAEKEAMKASLSKPSERSSYDNLSIPQSAYYNPNSHGRFGSQYVGD